MALRSPLAHHLNTHTHTHTHSHYCELQVIQTRFYGNKRVLAVVVRTGFATSKGGMVRSILFPRKLSLKFYADAMKFVLLLTVLGMSVCVCVCVHACVYDSLLPLPPSPSLFSVHGVHLCPSH